MIYVINESFNICFPDQFKCANILPKQKGTLLQDVIVKKYIELSVYFEQ